MAKALFASAILLLCCGALIAQCNDDCAFIKHVIASGDTKFADKPLWSYGGVCYSDIDGVFNCKASGQFDKLKPDYDRLLSALPVALGTVWTITDAHPSHINELLGDAPLFNTKARLSGSRKWLNLLVTVVGDKSSAALSLKYYPGIARLPAEYPDDKKLSPQFRRAARTLYDCELALQESSRRIGSSSCVKEFDDVAAARVNDADAYIERLLWQWYKWLNEEGLSIVFATPDQAKVQEAIRQAAADTKDCREEVLVGLNSGILGPQTTCTTKPVK